MKNLPLTNCPVCGGDGMQEINNEDFECACTKLNQPDEIRLVIMRHELETMLNQHRIKASANIAPPTN